MENMAYSLTREDIFLGRIGTVGTIKKIPACETIKDGHFLELKVSRGIICINDEIGKRVVDMYYDSPSYEILTRENAMSYLSNGIVAHPSLLTLAPIIELLHLPEQMSESCMIVLNEALTKRKKLIIQEALKLDKDQQARTGLTKKYLNELSEILRRGTEPSITEMANAKKLIVPRHYVK